MNRITIADKFKWFLDDYGLWILFGAIAGTMPFLPYYIVFLLKFLGISE